MISVVKVLFVGFLATTFFLTKLSIGLPVRSIILLALTGVFAMFFSRESLRFVKNQHGVLLLVTAFGALGLVLSSVRGSDSAIAFEQLEQTIVQVLLIIYCLYMTCMIAGLRFTITVFAICTATTGIVACLQFAGVDWSWDLRVLLANIQDESDLNKTLYQRQDRALGISLTTMNLAYQIVAVTVVLFMCAKLKLVSVRSFNILMIAALIAAFATEVRSLILGIGFVLIFYNVKEVRVPLIHVVIAGILVLAVATFFIGAESRVLNTSDGSAVGRIVLIRYGLLLVFENPFGYGWGFDTTQFSWIFWSQLIDYENASAVYSYGLHNYFLNFLIEYGVVGVLLVILAILANPGRFIELSVVFSGYFINSLFHNGGPTNGEIYFWIALSIVLFMQDVQFARIARVRNALRSRENTQLPVGSV